MCISAGAFWPNMPDVTVAASFVQAPLNMFMLKASLHDSSSQGLEEGTTTLLLHRVPRDSAALCGVRV